MPELIVVAAIGFFTTVVGTMGAWIARPRVDRRNGLISHDSFLQSDRDMAVELARCVTHVQATMAAQSMSITSQTGLLGDIKHELHNINKYGVRQRA